MAALSASFLIAADVLRRFSLWAPVLLYMAAIFYVSALPEPPIPAGTDKPLHGLAYLGLAFVVVRAVVGGLPRRIGMWSATIAMLITVAYGATDEAHQMFVPGRSAEMFDLLADRGGRSWARSRAGRGV